MMRAMSSRFWMMRSNQRRRICARTFGSAFAQGPKARSAASIAPTVSAWPKRGTRAIGLPVAGLSTGSTPAPTHLPSMRHWLLSRVGSASFIGKASGFGRTITEGAGNDYDGQSAPAATALPAKGKATTPAGGAALFGAALADVAGAGNAHALLSHGGGWTGSGPCRRRFETDLGHIEIAVPIVNPAGDLDHAERRHFRSHRRLRRRARRLHRAALVAAGRSVVQRIDGVASDRAGQGNDADKKRRGLSGLLCD